MVLAGRLKPAEAVPEFSMAVDSPDGPPALAAAESTEAMPAVESLNRDHTTSLPGGPGPQLRVTRGETRRHPDGVAGDGDHCKVN
jgi:hypothetical protein